MFDFVQKMYKDRLEEHEPVTPGALSDAHRAILSTPEAPDRTEFNLLMDSGQVEKAFGAMAPSSSFRKRKSEDFLKADAVLNEFRETHDKKTLSEQLRPLIESAVSKLSAENGELLRKAWAALDLSIISYFLGQAFA